MGEIQETTAKPIFLINNNLIPWNRNPEEVKELRQEGIILLNQDENDEGLTRLLEYHGIEHFQRKVGPYHIFANAAKYVADIAVCEQPHLYFILGEFTNLGRRILFKGQFSAYRQKEVSRSKVIGSELECSGKIFTFSDLNINPKKFSLEDLLFAGTKGTKAQERVEGILAGYKNVEQLAKEAHKRQRDSDYELGIANGSPRQCF